MLFNKVMVARRDMRHFSSGLEAAVALHSGTRAAFTVRTDYWGSGAGGPSPAGGP
jgi:hypothetical protein